MKLLAIGDNVVDYYEEQNKIYPGGNALNVAVISKVNGLDEVGYIGIFGDDFEADHVVCTLKKYDIDISRTRKAYGPNGKAVVALNEVGDRVFKSTNRAERIQSLIGLKLTDEDMTYIEQYDLIHSSINSEINHLLPHLKFKTITYDFSTKNKWNESYLKEVCPFVDIAFFSGSNMTEDEISETIDMAQKYGTKIIIVTLGEKGVICTYEKVTLRQDALETEVIDTMGAGDSFIAGFLTHYLKKRNLREALEAGAVSAAETCKINGAFGHGIILEKS